MNSPGPYRLKHLADEMEKTGSSPMREALAYLADQWERERAEAAALRRQVEALNKQREGGRRYISRCSSKLNDQRERIRLLERAVTDEGRLTRVHLVAWADSIRRRLGYEGSSEECFFRRVAEVLPESDPAPNDNEREQDEAASPGG